MKKALFLGMAASFFFAFTFILNRSMNLAGGYWLWSACLRYLFTLPIMAMLIARKDGIRWVCREIAAQPGKWILWSTIGFGLFYVPLTFGSTFGESWLAAATWQLTIVAGVILTPLWGKRIPGRNLAWSCLILVGVFLLQTPNLRRMDWRTMALTLAPILVAAFSYPLGNRKVMEFCPDWMGTFHRVFAMTLCSIPFWAILSVGALVFRGLPSSGQVVQSLLVAIFSGVVATVLFFRATDLVKQNQRQLAAVEATQSGEVMFTLLGGMLFLGDTAPGRMGIAGIVLIVAGMVGNSLSVASHTSAINELHGRKRMQRKKL